MIAPQDIIDILNDMAHRHESPEKMAIIFERLSADMKDLPADIRKLAFEIIASEKIIDDSFFDRDVVEYVSSITEIFSLNDILRFFDAKRGQKRRIYELIKTFEGEGKIIRTGARHGLYRPVDKNPNIMDLDEEEGTNVNIELPFLLHDLVAIYPKNVIIVAGEKDAGKTAFALNTAWMNRNEFDVKYFNSEMGSTELRKRLSKFPATYALSEWKKITWIQQACNFEDHIDPDGLNIVDFLEIKKEAFTVTEDIRRTFDKLKNGLLLIVMQKRSYKEYAVGGEGTLEKARLALNLEHAGRENLCRITVAKNWRGTDNPRGKICQYKIWNGGEMKMTNYWSDPDKKVDRGRGFQRKEDKDFPREE